MLKVRFFALLLTAHVAGCASLQPSVPTDAKPKASAGYIAGTFEKTNSRGFAFVVRNIETGAEYNMSFGNDTVLPSSAAPQVTAIEVPPGRYDVKQWMTYIVLTKEISAKSPMTNRYLALPFDVGADSVLYLGNFSANTTHTFHGFGGTEHWTINPETVSLEEARGAFLKRYPAFTNRAFVCHLCF
jgi:hypothetical protein